MPLDRDLILALTADEEGGDDNGVQWLLANRRPLIDAAYVINGDGGDPMIRDGQVHARNVQAWLFVKGYPNEPEEYHSADCYDGGPLDLRPQSARFP